MQLRHHRRTKQGYRNSFPCVRARLNASKRSPRENPLPPMVRALQRTPFLRSFDPTPPQAKTRLQKPPLPSASVFYTRYVFYTTMHLNIINGCILIVNIHCPYISVQRRTALGITNFDQLADRLVMKLKYCEKSWHVSPINCWPATSRKKNCLFRVFYQSAGTAP